MCVCSKQKLKANKAELHCQRNWNSDLQGFYLALNEAFVIGLKKIIYIH